MFAVRSLVVLLFAAVVLGEEDSEAALQFDFSLKVRLLGWAKTVALFKITYRADNGNALAIQDLNGGNLNIYEFAKTKSHFMVDSSSCNIIKINPSNLEKDPLFPIILTGENGLLTDASSLLRVDGEKNSTGEPDRFQNTETFKLTKTKEIEINEDNEKKNYQFTIFFTRTLAEKPEDQVPVSVRMESGEKVLTYEIFDFTTEISDEDFNVPDGYFCMKEEADATSLPEFALKTPSRIQFTKRGDEQSFRGWIDSRFKVRKEEAVGGGETVIIDMANNVEYTIAKENGRCTVQVLEKGDSITPANFLYSFDTKSKMQLLKEDVSVGTLKAFVLANSQVANVFLIGTPGDDSAIPLKVTTRLPSGQLGYQITEDFIEGFTDEVDWDEFDVSQCLAPESTDVFRIFFSIENNTAYGNPRDFQYQVLGLLMEWTGVKEPVRFMNLQPYADGSFSFTVLPPRANTSEPKSLEVVQKIVDLVKAGNAVVTKPDKSRSRVGLVTYETLGAPQATYRSIAVFWITFSVSILSLILGIFAAVIFIRRTPPQNYIRRQLGV